MANTRRTRRNSQILRAMDRARTVQLGMLPPPPKLDELQVEVFYDACDELGGDFYDFVSLAPTELGIVLADVSGHGVDAALLMAAAKKTIQIHGRRVASPVEVLKLACEDLASDLPQNSFVTVWYGVLDVRSGVMRYASAGHNPMLLLREGKVTSHQAKGVILSGRFVEKFGKLLEEAVIQLQPGDRVLLYTDGITEATNKKNTQFGLDRLQKALLKAGDVAMGGMLADLRKRVKKFQAGTEIDDDVTMIGLQYNGRPAEVTAWRPRVLTNLRHPTNSFVGREAETGRIREAFAQGVRTVTVIGVAGLGKTRVSVEAVRGLVDDYPGGVWFVPLAEKRDAASVAAAVASALEVSLEGSEPVEALSSSLAVRGPTLLLIDGAEHLVDHVREFVTALAEKCRDVRCLITSQLRVGADGECEILLAPLAVPATEREVESVESALSYHSIRLFMDRAVQARPEFELTDANMWDVARVCSMLEGVPLAIEIAASRIATLSPARVLGQLREPSGKVVADPDRTEHRASLSRALRDALEWSYGQLTAWEQSVLRQLSVFSGGFTIEAAECVVTLPRSARGYTVSDAVESLLAKSMLWRESTPYGMRFAAYSALRGMVSGLAPASEAERALAHHMEYFAEYVASLDAQRRGPGAIEADDRIEMDRANIEAAFETALRLRNAEAAVVLLEALHWLCHRAFPADAWIRMNVALEERIHELPKELQIRLLYCLLMVYKLTVRDPMARSAYMLGEVTEAKRLSQSAESAIDRGRLALAVRAVCDAWRDEACAEKYNERAIDAFREAGDDWWLGTAIYERVELLAFKPGRDRDHELAEINEGVQLIESTGDPVLLAILLNARSGVYLRRREIDAAADDLARAMKVFQSTGMHGQLVKTFLGMGIVNQRRGDLEEALACWHEAKRLVLRTANMFSLSDIQLRLGWSNFYLGDLDAAREAITKGIEVADRIRSSVLGGQARVMLAAVELEAGDYNRTLEILGDKAADTPPMPAWVVPTAVAVRALAHMAVGKVPVALGESRIALENLEADEKAIPEMVLFAMAARMRVLQAARQNAAADAMAERARRYDTDNKDKMNPFSYLGRIARDLLDSMHTARRVARVRAVCSRCGQTYMGSPARLEMLKRCLNCGLEPFTAAPPTA